MKPCHNIGCVIICGLFAFVLVTVSISMDQWWYQPSMDPTQTGDKVMLPYRLMGLWNYESDEITKYKINNTIITVADGVTFKNVTFVIEDPPGWFTTVKVFEVMGCIFTCITLALSVAWMVMYYRTRNSCTLCFFSGSCLNFYIVSGSFILFGIILLVGKTDTEQIAWGPSVAGFGGAFCIMAACIIRWGQQEKFAS